MMSCYCSLCVIGVADVVEDQDPGVYAVVRAGDDARGYLQDALFISWCTGHDQEVVEAFTTDNSSGRAALRWDGNTVNVIDQVASFCGVWVSRW